jgi:hypothetical protein
VFLTHSDTRSSAFYAQHLQNTAVVALLFKAVTDQFSGYHKGACKVRVNVPSPRQEALVPRFVFEFLQHKVGRSAAEFELPAALSIARVALDALKMRASC